MIDPLELIMVYYVEYAPNFIFFSKLQAGCPNLIKSWYVFF